MKIQNIITIILAVAVLVLVTTSRFSPAGGAPDGTVARVATSSAQTIGTTANTIFATSTNCTSRVITTTSKAVMLTFSNSSGQTPTGALGHLQLASTTVSYEANLYGCDAVKAYGFDSSSNITTTELR